MCGFLSFFSSNPKKISEKSLSNLLNHRGPDRFETKIDQDYQAMFWRLSIVDQEKSHQPMTSNSSMVTVLFNGEIYNYKELRSKLKKIGYTFCTDGDTEVILRAYEEWGNRCYQHFDGMYAILIIDKKNNKFSIARDRLGVKPLFFKNDKEDFYVASEQKAIINILNYNPSLDQNSLLYYLNFQSVPNNKTLFNGILKLPPGFVYEYNLKNRNFIRSIKIANKINKMEFNNYDDYREVLRNEIVKQAALTLDTDLPICFHLSGGIDSNSLIGLCRELDPQRDFTCVTSIVGGKKDKEWDFIQESADFHNVALEVADINEESFFNYFDDVLYYLDEPVGDAGAIAQFMVNEIASKKAKIVYSGQGFDEMFFGYSRNLAAYVIQKWGPDYLNINNPQFVKLPKSIQKFLFGWDDFLVPLYSEPSISAELAVYKKLCRFDPFVNDFSIPINFQRQLQANAYELHDKSIYENDNLHDYMMDAELKIQLPSLLHMEDRASMRYSIETRVPFCTSSILDLAKMGKLEWKFNSEKPKGILRDIFSNVIPKHILNRQQKVGRPIPFQKWIRNDKHPQYLNNLKNKSDMFFDMLGFDYVQFALERTGDYDRTIWGAVCLSEWIDIYNIDV